MSTSYKNAFSDLSSELAKTRTMLERIPEDKFDWTPHEKSWNLFTLARHIANVPTWIGITLNSDGLNMAEKSPERKLTTNVSELLEEFDANCKAALAHMDTTSDEALEAPWTLSHGDHVIFTQPKREIIREWSINHMVHHRAQLSIYFRLLGVSLPPLYGPSADES